MAASSWHQASAHWGLDSNQIVTVWLALTPVTRDKGAVQMLPGSHRGGQVDHRDTVEPNNILKRGQTITHAIDEDQTVWVTLEPGEVSLHHVDMWHASPANTTNRRRVGVALRYMTPLHDSNASRRIAQPCFAELTDMVTFCRNPSPQAWRAERAQSGMSDRR